MKEQAEDFLCVMLIILKMLKDGCARDKIYHSSIGVVKVYSYLQKLSDQTKKVKFQIECLQNA